MRSLIVIIIYITFFGCINNKVNKEFATLYPNYILKQFSNSEYNRGEWWIDYFYYNIDTSEYLTFAVCVQATENHNEGDVIFNEYVIKEKICDTIYIQSFDENKNLLYSYKRLNDEYYFISGKYFFYYKYKHGELSKNQREYFERNEDSIVSNIVNEIPLDDAILRKNIK
ncbi:MAG: hypothetical protein CVU09_07425 [Bacteroidetes bacterium HGW-Bacteroidetes-4]|jgi:hypothetical protein|nr:MAG: hypothetical protein CVU09_07425 [Bacteroidetes bacterium HGW-Bacteroidetes-4]